MIEAIFWSLFLIWFIWLMYFSPRAKRWREEMTFWKELSDEWKKIKGLYGKK